MKKIALICASLALIAALPNAYAHTEAYNAHFLPSDQKTMVVSPEQFKKYEGDYQLAPGFTISVFQKDGKFYSQGTGQGAFEIFAESEHAFYATVADIKIRFTIGTDGKASHFNLTQSGQSIPPAPRVK